jgi:hypothetical protein
MVRYNSIQPLSFRIHPDATDMVIAYDRLALPDDFKEDLKTASGNRNLPVDNLNRLTRMILPDVYSIDSYAGNRGYNWLRAASGSIEIESIQMMLSAWLHAYSLDAVPIPDLKWIPTTTSLDNWGKYANGTAKALDNAIYDLLPSLLACRIVDKPITIGGTDLYFYQVAKDPSAKGVELISWTPLEYVDRNNQSWFYSYYIHISVALIPFSDTPYINVYTGIRRWVSTYESWLPNERLSVYMRAALPYLPGIGSTHNFQVATAKIKRTDDGYLLDWSDKLPEMLDYLGLNPKVPSPESLRRSPADSLKRQKMPNIALVHSNRMNTNHAVNPGVSPKDRYDLIQALLPHWEDWLQLIEPRKKIKKASQNYQTQGNLFYEKDAEHDKRWERLAQQHQSQPINIEIYYRREDSRDAMLDALAELLGLQSYILGTHERNGLQLTIKTYEVGAIGAELPSVDNQSSKARVEQRKHEILGTLDEVKHTTVALVEILAPQKYEPASTDPKDAIRYGFAHAHRLTQFFTPISAEELKQYESQDKKVPDRFKNAALDALRQMGIHTAGINMEGGWRLNGWGWNAAGYWLIRQSKKESKTNKQHFLPSLVLIDGETGVVYAWVNGMDGMRPYHEVLLLVGQGKINPIRDKEAIANRLAQDLEQVGLAKDTVIMVDTTQSGMRHNIWRWLQDGNITINEVEFANGQKWLPDDKSNLRIVRVRNVNHETPEWFAKAGTQIGLTSGVHQVNKHVFASIARTATTQQINRQMTKTETKNASSAIPVPGYYELTVALKQGYDKAEEIAQLVHDLRDASAQFRDETSHALPLHLGKLIEEYLLWVD